MFLVAHCGLPKRLKINAVEFTFDPRPFYRRAKPIAKGKKVVHHVMHGMKEMTTPISRKMPLFILVPLALLFIYTVLVNEWNVPKKKYKVQMNILRNIFSMVTQWQMQAAAKKFPSFHAKDFFLVCKRGIYISENTYFLTSLL